METNVSQITMLGINPTRTDSLLACNRAARSMMHACIDSMGRSIMCRAVLSRLDNIKTVRIAVRQIEQIYLYTYYSIQNN